jgi:SAM-dependent methyltransferase
MPFNAMTRRAMLGAGAAMLCLGGAAAWDDDILFERESPYVPSPQDVVDRMLDFAGLKAGELVVDLGSGDGRIVVTAAKRGARGYGVDINPKLVAEARQNAAKAGVSDRATFEERDLFKTDISRADLLTLYLLPLTNLDLRPMIMAQMRPGARIVAHAYHLGADWPPDASDNIRGRTLYSWVVPAQIGGRWRVTNEEVDFTLHVAQTFQSFKATAHVDLRTLPKTVKAHATDVRDGRIDGAEVRFLVDLGDWLRVFRGRVDGDTIYGIAPRGWSAKRISK